MEKLLSEVFELWDQPGRLGNHPLADALATTVATEFRQFEISVDPVFGRAKALRRVIQAGINTLAVEGEAPPVKENDPKWCQKEWRYYNILTLSLGTRASPKKVADRICLALGGHFYDEKSKALKMLASVLMAWEGSPMAQSEPIKLALPPGGGALRLADKYYIERQADADLNFIPARPGQTFIIRGPRQMGKTSLLIRIANGLRRDYGAKIVHFDFESIDQPHLTSLDTVLYQLAQSILFDLGLDIDQVDQHWRNTRLTPIKRMERLLEQNALSAFDAPLVLAMDEVDRLLPTAFRQDFFSMVRTWHNNRATRAKWDKLNLILVISTEPYLLINDLNLSPFNVGYKLNLDDFDELQLKRLNLLYGSPLPDVDLPNLKELLNGHPFLTSVALYTLKRHNLPWRELERQAILEAGPFTEHLQHLFRLLTHQPTLQAAFEKVLQHKACDDDHSLFRLLKAGLIKKSGDQYVCRCYLYQRYFSRELSN